MQRRDFIKSTGIISLGATIGINANSFNMLSSKNTENSQNANYIEQNPIYPPALSPEAAIALVAPAGYISEEEYKECTGNLESQGYKVYPGKYVKGRSGYFSGTDKERAEDLNNAFANKKIDAIWCARGGYGCARIFPLLDYDVIRKNPKILIGYSDITALNYALYSQTGLVSFHGPVGTSTFDDYSKKWLAPCISGFKSTCDIENFSGRDPSIENDSFVISPGEAEGKLVGGNLSIVVSMIGTKYDVTFKDTILYLEEVGEEPYRIDRMLTQMRLAGKFDNVRGIIIGIFVKCKTNPAKSGIDSSPSFKEVLTDCLAPLNIPIAYGYSFGHIKYKFTLPFGIKARMETEGLKLRLLESPVK